MNLKRYIELNNTLNSLTEDELFSYLQKAYRIVVDYIKIDPSLYPVLMRNKAHLFGSWDNVCARVKTGSEIRFKEVKTIPHVDFVQSTSTLVDITNNDRLLVGELDLDKYGFESLYDTMNNNHSVTPIICNQHNYYECTNYDECINAFFIIQAYQYPYPVLVADNPLTVEYRYDIKWMSDAYGYDNLIIDEMLGICITLKALQLYYEDYLQLNTSRHYDYLCTTLLNMFNSNKDSYNNNRTTVLGVLNGSY